MPNISEILNGVDDYSYVGYHYGQTSIGSQSCSEVLELTNNGNTNREIIQNSIWDAQYGDTICIPAGKWRVKDSIYLDKDGVGLSGLSLNVGGNITPAELWFYTNKSGNLNNIGVTDGIVMGGSAVTGSSYIVNEIHQDGWFNSDIISELQVDDYVKIEVQIGNDFIEFYDMVLYSNYYPDNNEDTENWNPGWKDFVIRRVNDIEDGNIYLDLPFRYPISFDIFDNIRVSKINLKKDIGLSGLNLSNAIYYDDAWKYTGLNDFNPLTADYWTSDTALIKMNGCVDCFISDISSATIGINWYDGIGSSEPGQPGASDSPPSYDDVLNLLSQLFHALDYQSAIDGVENLNANSIKASFDNIMAGLELDHNGTNIINEVRHLASNGIKISNSKNITIQNTSMKLPINRGSEKNGILFGIDKSNEILIHNCEGYRGRRNFAIGGWGTSGVVLNQIHSEGGWGFGIDIDDLLHQMGIGGAGQSEAHLYYYNSQLPSDFNFQTYEGESLPNSFGDRYDMGQVENSGILEASGLVHSRKNSTICNDPGDCYIQYNPNGLYEWTTNSKHILWTHNDHTLSVEDGAGMVYAINAHGAKNVASYFVRDNENQRIYMSEWGNDWEDIAIGPSPDASSPSGCVEYNNIPCTTWPLNEMQCTHWCECSDGSWNTTMTNDGYCSEDNVGYEYWQTTWPGCPCTCMQDCQDVETPNYDTFNCYPVGGCYNNEGSCQASCEAFCETKHGILANNCNPTGWGEFGNAPCDYSVWGNCVITDSNPSCEDVFGDSINLCANGQCSFNDGCLTGFDPPSNISECNCSCCGGVAADNSEPLNYPVGSTWDLIQQQNILYIGDIGKGIGWRPSKHIFRCPEPDIESPGINDDIEPYQGNIQCDVLRFQYVNPACDYMLENIGGWSYGDAPDIFSFSALQAYLSCEYNEWTDGFEIDAETLLVDPISKKIYIISKYEFYHTVWELDNPVNDCGSEYCLHNLSNSSGFTGAHYIGHIKDLWINKWTHVNQITGGDVSPNGKEIILKTYGGVFVINRYKGQTLGEALVRNNSHNVNYIAEPMGEAIAFDANVNGGTLLNNKSRGYFTLSEETSVGDIVDPGQDLPFFNLFAEDSDWFSRYGRIELMSLFFGYNGYSGTTKALSNSILVTDSDIYDGWISVNRESLFGGRGHSTTNTTLWNIRGNPNPNIDEPFKDMAVPGMSSIVSFQPTSHNGNNGTIVNPQDMNVYTDSTNGNFTQYYNDSTSVLGSFFSIPEETIYTNYWGEVTVLDETESFQAADYVNNIIWMITTMYEATLKQSYQAIQDSTGMEGWLGSVAGSLPDCCYDENTESTFSGLGCNVPVIAGVPQPCIGMCNYKKSIMIAGRNMGNEPYGCNGFLDWLPDVDLPGQSGAGGMCAGLNDLSFGVPDVNITMNENRDITLNIEVVNSSVRIDAYQWECGSNTNMSGEQEIDTITYNNTFIANWQGDTLVGYMPQYSNEPSQTTTIGGLDFELDLDLFGNNILGTIADFLADIILENPIEHSINQTQNIIALKIKEAVDDAFTSSFGLLLNEWKFLTVLRFGLLQTHNFTLGVDGSHYKTGVNDVVEYDDSIPNLYFYQNENAEPYDPIEGDMYGCTDPSACNYDPISQIEDGSCWYHNWAVENGHQCGDINGDGIVNVIDVVLLAECVMESCNEPQYDINGDGITNVIDIIALVNQIFSTTMRGTGYSNKDFAQVEDILSKLYHSEVTVGNDKPSLSKLADKIGIKILPKRKEKRKKKELQKKSVKQLVNIKEKMLKDKFIKEAELSTKSITELEDIKQKLLLDDSDIKIIPPNKKR